MNDGQLTILVYRDNGQVCALFGDNIQDGTVGIGNTTAEALVDLAKAMEDEGITDELDSWI
jgi:hypothetical protein